MTAAPLRAAILCPGRGSYGRGQLGTLGAAGSAPAEPLSVVGARDEAVAAIDGGRRARGEGSVLELDRAERFSARDHLRADNASELILASAAADLGLVRAAVAAGMIEPVAVSGNSLGFYVALYASGALTLSATARLIGTMGALQVQLGALGGQLLQPVCDPETWRPDERRLARVDAALAEVEGAHLSIRLGGSRVLAAGDDASIRALEAALPTEERDGRRFPLRLAGHSAFHTPHMQPLAHAAREALGDLPVQAPAVPLVSGDGAVWRPLTADPQALLAYTLGAQVLTPFDFTTAVRVILREYAPDLLIATGPGETLGGPIGQILVEEGWSGVDSADRFKARQRGEGGAPIFCALARSGDRARLLELLA